MKRIGIACIVVGLTAILAITASAAPTMTDVVVSENTWGPFLIYRNLVEARAGSSPGAYGDWEIGIRTEAGGFTPVILNSNYIWPNAADPNSWLADDPNSLFTLTFTKETGTIDFTLGYSRTLSYDCNDYTGVGMDKVYLMARSDALDRTCTISELKVNGTSPQNVAELVGTDTQTYATIKGLDYEDFTLTGNIVFSYENQAEHSEIEALIAFGTPGPEPEGPNDIWTLVDKASVVEEGPEENPWVIKLESVGDQAPPWGSVLFKPPEPMTFNDVNELSADFNMTEGSFRDGSPRFSVLIDWNDSHIIDEGDEYALIYWGTHPDFNDCPEPDWYNTGNLYDADPNDHRVNLLQFGGPFYSTIEEAKNRFGDKEVLEVILVLDGSWMYNQVMLVDNIKVNRYTYNAYPLGPEPGEPSDGDVNEDGEVTILDLWIMAGNWLRNDCLVESCENADIAPDIRDGNVNDLDFTMLAMHWLEGVKYDTAPPEPNVMTWASEPNAIAGDNSIIMTATTASDPSGVKYYFKNATLPTHNSNSQPSAIYTDTELNSGTEYTYRVKARDMSPNKNETLYSAP
ncbi:MAG: choice-of-anchor W domain-containing protein, partial [Planctomycetota bacterium]